MSPPQCLYDALVSNSRVPACFSAKACGYARVRDQGIVKALGRGHCKSAELVSDGNSKFRGWLDDLLDSAWEGCQNSDVLIESPSAIAGYRDHDCYEGESVGSLLESSRGRAYAA
jgi:hypothetical protein